MSAAWTEVQQRAAAPSIAIETFRITILHRHSGMRPLGRRPGIHNPRPWLWIPGTLVALAPRNDELGRYASLTASVLKSLPSASNDFLTVLLAARGEGAYNAFGESWSRNTSGRIIERAFKLPWS